MTGGKSLAQKHSLRLLTGCLLCCLTLFSAPPAEAIDWLKSGSDLLQGAQPNSPLSTTDLSELQINAGLKDALRVGSERVVSQLSALDGFNADPQIHIPLPDTFNKVRSMLATVGQAQLLDDLELKLNRAAEKATQPAKPLFLDAIKAMTVEDAQKIFQGPDDAATRYFQDKMEQPLGEAMQPIVADSMAEVGAVQAYEAVMGEYKSIPFVPDVKTDLTAYVVEKGMDGIFFYLGKEEAAIRQNPAKRTTEILQSVFGAK